jgi:hypothetical protein
METTMTAAIVAAQGHGITNRTKTCSRASTEGEGATWRMTAHEFALSAPIRARSSEDPQSPVRNLDVGDARYARHDLEGVDQPALISQFHAKA